MATLRQVQNETFINPYNFVPAKKGVQRKPIPQGELTGYVTCTLRVKDRLILPDRNAPAGQDDEGQRTFDFFSVGGKPVIPGSEIRGCIRSAFEAVTGSCFSVVNSNTLSARKAKPNTERLPGVLVKDRGDWVIYAAEYCSAAAKKKPGHEDFTITRTWQKKGEAPHLTQTYFKIDDSYENYYVCQDKDIEDFVAILRIYIENETKNLDKKEWQKDAQLKIKTIWDIIHQIERMAKEEDSDMEIPVFYQLNDKGTKLIYFSPAQTGRVLFDNTVIDLLGDLKPCSGEGDEYCPACALFGTLGKNHPIASRVRFSDATALQYTKSDYLTIPELAAPKISSVEFYTLNTNHKGTRNVPMWDYDTAGIALRGRKFYLHSPAQQADEFGKRQIKTKAMETGSKFTFKLYFDNISENELKQLLWVLTYGENDLQGKYMHKLGSGRPVGYGSAKIAVDEICVREKSDELDYIAAKKTYADYEGGYALLDTEAADTLLLIADYDYAAGHRVCYPIADDGKGGKNSTAGHQWFSANRRPNHTFCQILPEMDSKASQLELMAMKADTQSIRSTQSKSGGKKIHFDFSKFENGKTYKAVVTRDVNEYVVKILVCAQTAQVTKKYLPADIQRDIDAAIKNAAEFKVIFKGKNKNGYPMFFVAK